MQNTFKNIVNSKPLNSLPRIIYEKCVREIRNNKNIILSCTGPTATFEKIELCSCNNIITTQCVCSLFTQLCIKEEKLVLYIKRKGFPLSVFLTSYCLSFSIYSISCVIQSIQTYSTSSEKYSVFSISYSLKLLFRVLSEGPQFPSLGFYPSLF